MKKRIPYGISDFKLLKEENYYFVDKTVFIEILESLSERYLMFLRPRRFGKSLFIAILEAYYSLDFKDDFENIFSDTYIGDNPTKERSSYHTMRFDFSSVSLEDVEYFFTHTVKLELEAFIDRYSLDIAKESHPKGTFENILKYFQKEKEKKLYILIDEYDHFANRLLFHDREGYKRAISQKSAFFKEFFTLLKVGTSGNDAPIKRVFITGVTPMTMYDVTSGFNIGANISLKKELNDMMGFNEKEVEELLAYYDIDMDKRVLKEWYDNYIFSPSAAQSVYNTDMILYFVKEYLSNDNKAPSEMIDINVRSDYSRLRHVIYTDHRLNGNFESLRELIVGESISLNNLIQDFSALDLEREENFKSLLFYLGLATIKRRSFELELHIPNETIKRIDMEFLDRSLEMEDIFRLDTNRYQRLLKDFALNGNIEVFSFLAKEIERNSGIRDYIYKEQHIKSMYLSYLSIAPYYIAKSEKELQKGFADIFIKPFNNPYVRYFALVEFKYIKRQESAESEKVELLMKEAKEQLLEYAKDELVQEYERDGVKLKMIAMIFHGWELLRMEEVG